MIHTRKLAETSANSSKETPSPEGQRYARLFSSIQDIGELLQPNCSQGHDRSEAGPRFHHRRVKTGALIYRLGQSFESLYIVRYGFVKIVLRNADGDERVLSFPTKGNLLGFDGVYNNHYGTEAIALTDCELVVIPFKRLLATSCSCRELEQMVYMAISREFAEEHAGVGLSSPLKCDARVARFLEALAKRYAALGYSSKEFSLPMTRRDIGCYLGLSLETVSRSLSTLASLSIIGVHRQHVKILRPELLHRFHSSRLEPAHNGRGKPSATLAALRPIKTDRRFRLTEVKL